jgi:tetratricopeptide (TPR) repeat protein
VTRYSFVSQRPDGAYLYHENARAHLLARVKQDADHFREMSRRAAEFFAPTPLARRPFGTGEGAAGEFVFEWLYHWLAVDDEQAFDQLMNLYQQLEFHYNLAACGRLLALAQEQRDLLTGDRPQWLRYYQGRLLQYSQRRPEALAAWKPLLQEELAPKLKSWLANHMGMVYDSLGRWADALAHYQTSLAIKRELGDRQGEASTLGSLGILSRKTGRWDEAVSYYKQQLEICRELGDRPGESGVLNNLGVVYAKKGLWTEAIQCYEDSLKLEREMGDRLEEARTLGNLGDVFKETGEWAKAEDYNKQAVAILHDSEDKEQLGDRLEELGELYRTRGLWAEAVQVHEEALQVWRELAAMRRE